ncbi:MAG: hypothetical protein MRY21_03675 [Simkaniaceae bacterium]|nr:hypothetical protein [Simkaniaceae bacterium]
MLITLAVAFGLIIICAALLGIGKLITGKSKLHCKRCSKPEEDCKVCGKKSSERR